MSDISFCIPIHIFVESINSLALYTTLSVQEIKVIESIKNLIRNSYCNDLLSLQKIEEGKWIINNSKGDFKILNPKEQGEFFAHWFQFYNATKEEAKKNYAKMFYGSSIKYCLSYLNEKILPYDTLKILKSFENENLYAIFVDEAERTIISINDRKIYRHTNIPENFLLTLNNYFTQITPINEQPIKITDKESDTAMEAPTIMKNFDFGPVTSGVQMSPYGLAIQKDDRWLSYNSTTEQTVDVTGVTFDFHNMIFKIPVATNNIQKGDIIIHERKPMFITGVVGTKVEAIDIMASEEKVIIPVANIFGFNFITKIVPLVNIGNTIPSPENPFGNIMPLMAMSMFFDDENKDNTNKTTFGGMNMEKMFMTMTIMSMFNQNGSTNPLSQMFNFGAVTPISNPPTTKVEAISITEDDN